VLSFAVIADYFPKEFAARANGALNLLHFGWAFTMQYGIGLVVEQWPSQDGHYPVAAYQAAFGLSLALQAATLTWFAVPWLRSFVRQLYLLFAPRHAGPDDQLTLVATAAEGASLRPLKVWNGETNAVADRRIVLVIAGLLLSFVPGIPNVSLNPDVIFLVVLPPLLYSAAWVTSWREFKFNLVSICMLAFGLVGFTVAGVAATSKWVFAGFDWRLGSFWEPW